MQYSCHDITKILASLYDAAYNHDAFMAHIESCASCRQLGILEPQTEEMLGSLQPCSAPDTLELNIMRSVRQETRNARPISVVNQARLAFLAAIYLIIAAITMSNREAITSGMVSALNELDRLWRFFGVLGIENGSLLSSANKLFLSPMILTALMGITMVIWIYSILCFRDTN
jgi:hypothetical protein